MEHAQKEPKAVLVLTLVVFGMNVGIMVANAVLLVKLLSLAR